MKRRIRLRGINGDVEGKTWNSEAILRAGRLTEESSRTISRVASRPARNRVSEFQDLPSTSPLMPGILICGGSLYKDAESLKLGKFRDEVVIQAEKICESLSL